MKSAIDDYNLFAIYITMNIGKIIGTFS